MNECGVKVEKLVIQSGSLFADFSFRCRPIIIRHLV